MQEENIITNTYWADNERFADIMNVGMFQAQKVLSADELEEANGILSTMVGKKDRKIGIERYRDVVKKAAYGANFVIMGIENQTDIHYVMPVKVMGYDFMGYDKQWKEIKKRHRKAKDLEGAEYLSGFSKNDKLAPICTLVLYYGEEPWNGPTKLSELLDFSGLPEAVREAIVDYPIHVIDIRRFEDSEKLETDARLLFGVLQREGDAEKMKSYRDENEEAFSNISEETYDAIAVLSKSEGILEMKEKSKKIADRRDLCEGFRGMLEADLKEAVEKAKVQIRAQIEAEVRTQGMNQGMTQGITEGKRDERITCIFELLCDLGDIPMEIETKITEENDMELLSKWFRIAAKSDSIEQFIMKM